MVPQISISPLYVNSRDETKSNGDTPTIGRTDDRRWTIDHGLSSAGAHVNSSLPWHLIPDQPQELGHGIVHGGVQCPKAYISFLDFHEVNIHVRDFPCIIGIGSSALAIGFWGMTGSRGAGALKGGCNVICEEEVTHQGVDVAQGCNARGHRFMPLPNDDRRHGV